VEYEPIGVLVGVEPWNYPYYLPTSLRSNLADLIDRFSNLIVLRTFSKAYGLAALRIGFAVAQRQLSELLNLVRPPFNTSVFAQVGAREALEDVEFL
jgi:histidinol-phosphate aminotransferase